MPSLGLDPYWEQALFHIRHEASDQQLICAPNEFLWFHPGTVHYFASSHVRPDAFRLLVLHKGMREWVDRRLLEQAERRWTKVFENEVFVVLRNEHPGDRSHHEDHLHGDSVAPVSERLAWVVVTHERPWALEQSLPILVDQCRAVVVVDDGTSQEGARINRNLAYLNDVDYIALPTNRGLCAAMNTGVSYFLADPDVAWIGVLQDDVLLDDRALEALDAVGDETARPLVSLYHDPSHPVLDERTIGGWKVLGCRSTSGQALVAHRRYWQGVLPIPTPYLGAPKAKAPRAGQGSDEDWWVASWSPASAPKLGLPVTVLPGLATHLGGTRGASTWAP